MLPLRHNADSLGVRAACLRARGTKDRQQVLRKVGCGPAYGDAGIPALQQGAFLLATWMHLIIPLSSCLFSQQCEGAT